MNNKAVEIIEEAKALLNPKFEDTGDGFRYTDKQIAAIVALKYKLHWPRRVLFNYICDTFPEEDFRSRLTEKERRFWNTSALYQLMTAKQKSKIIQRLDQIKKRNVSK